MKVRNRKNAAVAAARILITCEFVFNQLESVASVLSGVSILASVPNAVLRRINIAIINKTVRAIMKTLFILLTPLELDISIIVPKIINLNSINSRELILSFLASNSLNFYLVYERYK